MFRVICSVVCSLALLLPAGAIPPSQHQPAPIERRPPPQAQSRTSQAPVNQAPGAQPSFTQRPRDFENASTTQPSSQPPNRSNPNNAARPAAQQHLAQWMNAHRNLSLADQQTALENEPGFRQLKAPEQQRLHQRLQQLNAMPLQQQQRVIERNEAMERLAPAQRLQIRTTMAQLSDLPEPRRHAVARTFRSLQEVPFVQRQAYLNSPQCRSQFNDQERNTLTNLVNISPFIPPVTPPQAPPYPRQ